MKDTRTVVRSGVLCPFPLWWTYPNHPLISFLNVYFKNGAGTDRAPLTRTTVVIGFTGPFLDHLHLPSRKVYLKVHFPGPGYTRWSSAGWTCRRASGSLRFVTPSTLTTRTVSVSVAPLLEVKEDPVTPRYLSIYPSPPTHSFRFHIPDQDTTVVVLSVLLLRRPFPVLPFGRVPN